MTNFGPTGQLVYERTYSRTLPDGTKETWPDTVRRVVDGNLALRPEHQIKGEREELLRLMEDFKILPAGRHLWMTGVPGRQYLFNCHVSGFGERLTDHFEFTFLRLAEGGGVGANYSNRYLEQYDEIQGWNPVVNDYGAGEEPFQIHIVCDPSHPDYQSMKDAGLLSETYASQWAGAYQVPDTREGWAEAVTDLVETYYRPAKNRNRVFDVSRVRWKGARLQSSGGTASGPEPLAILLHEVGQVMNARIGQRLDGIGAMEIDHALATAVVSGGNRRSARMAIMHWADPQIFDFLTIKQHTGRHWTTNISVEVDDDFFAQAEALTDGQADRVLAGISRGMLENGEPGFWNSSLSNVGEPNPVIATNPCGEIALQEWENCNLGHVNLAAFVDQHGNADVNEMLLAHLLMTRFLIRATYGDVTDPKQAEVLARNRRIGVGHLGVASYLALTGKKYSDAPGDWRFEALLEDLTDVIDRTADSYSHALRIPVPVKTRTVAPTGTIAKMPGVSEGIHPIFARYFIRRIRLSEINPTEAAKAEEYRQQGYHVEKDLYAPNTLVVSLPTKDSLLAAVEDIYGAERADEIVESAADITLEDMLRFQRMYQEYWADNAVSYTVNVDPDQYTSEDLADAITNFGPDLKGATVFPEMSFPQSPYQRITKADYALYEDWQKDVADGVDEACATGACPVR